MASANSGQAKFCIVLDIAKVQPVRRKRRCSALAIATLKDFAKRSKTSPTSTDVHQLADDIAHHMMQVGIGPKRQGDQLMRIVSTAVANTLDTRLNHCSDG